MQRGFLVTAGLTALILTLGSSAQAQDLARQGTLSFSQGLKYSDNVGLTAASESGFVTSTGVDLTLRWETRREVFSFGVGTDLEGEFGGGLDDDFEFQRNRANLLYTREGADARLRFSASYSESQLDDDVYDPGDGSPLVFDQGSVERSRLSFRVVTGEGGPVGTTWNALYRKLDYQDTVDPDLVDEETRAIDGLARFQVNPALTLRARAGLSVTEEDDGIGTEREESFLGFGIATETASGLSITGDLLYDRTKTTNTTPATTRDEGWGVDIALTQERPNGTLGLAVASRIDDAGRRTSVEATRAFETKVSQVSLSLGVADVEGESSLQLIGGLDYSRELPRGALTASFSQEAGSRDGDAYLDTVLSLNYTQDINAISGWRAGLAYAASEELGGPGDDSRTTATLAYTRELAQDWNMNAGLEHVHVTESGAADRSSNTVFFTIRRDVTFGF